jgi:hypothetical protein
MNRAKKALNRPCTKTDFSLIQIHVFRYPITGGNRGRTGQLQPFTDPFTTQKGLKKAIHTRSQNFVVNLGCQPFDGAQGPEAAGGEGFDLAQPNVLLEPVEGLRTVDC